MFGVIIANCKAGFEKTEKRNQKNADDCSDGSIVSGGSIASAGQSEGMSETDQLSKIWG